MQRATDIQLEPRTGNTLAKVNLYCLSYPLSTPIETVMGVWTARPAVLVRVEDAHGLAGWGEIWCNFPPHGAEYRTKLAQAVLPNVVPHIDLGQPFETFRRVRDRLKLLSLQAGEGGPADGIASGLDIAVHDLVARRAGLPLVRHLGGTADKVQAYASGMDSRQRAQLIPNARDMGFDKFKLRVGFGLQSDMQTLESLDQLLQPGETIAIDANQAWTLPDVDSLSGHLRASNLAWVEEPLPVDRPASEWAQAASLIQQPLSGGENMRSMAEFEAACANDTLQIIQPDICKWGGLSEVSTIARCAASVGKSYYPHFLGSGVGLIASAHALAAFNSSGMLEIDVNENGLREMLAGDFLSLSEGCVAVPEQPGIGLDPDLDLLNELLVLDVEIIVG